MTQINEQSQGTAESGWQVAAAAPASRAGLKKVTDWQPAAAPVPLLSAALWLWLHFKPDCLL